MNSINIALLERIKAKLTLGWKLTDYETAYYTLYGDKLTESA